VNSGKNLSHVLRVGIADVEDVAAGIPPHSFQLADDDVVAVDTLIGHRLVERIPERILSGNTQIERAGRR